jgi:hypothetical protein
LNAPIPPETLRALEDVNSKEELGDKFVDLAVEDLENSIAAEDLQNIKQVLSEELEEDPYLEEKLERISSLLGKTN